MGYYARDVTRIKNPPRRGFFVFAVYSLVSNRIVGRYVGSITFSIQAEKDVVGCYLNALEEFSTGMRQKRAKSVHMINDPGL